MTKFNNNTLLIIGNGQSILSHKIGPSIDNYSTIARINNYKLNGYEHYLGNKTNIWINGANSKLKIRKEPPNKTVVMIPSSIIKKKKALLVNFVSKRLDLKEDKFKITPLDEIKKFEEHIKHKRLTTGMYGILWGLKHYNEVIIHGFDFFINSKSHYYDSKLGAVINEYILNKGNKHDNNKEKECVEKMIAENKIKKLIDVL